MSKLRFTLRKPVIEEYQWLWNADTLRLYNPAFGTIQLFDVYAGDARKWRQPGWAEARGEINIVANAEGKIAFNMQERPLVLDPALYAETWAQGVPDYFDFAEEARGVAEWELVRGFTKKVLGEVAEEARYLPRPVESSWHVNANTALFITSPFVKVCRALPAPSCVSPDEKENILFVQWLSPEEIRGVETLCGLTKAALWDFRLWAQKQADEFWQEIGKRL